MLPYRVEPHRQLGQCHSEEACESYRYLLLEFLDSLSRGPHTTPGMRVLDIGCGVGDVSLLAADLVGRSGTVGIDINERSLEIGFDRATALGRSHITCQQRDPNDLAF